MLDLLAEYGKGSNGFYSDWWINESWAKEKPPAGTWKTYEEQKALLKKGFDFPHPAVLAEIVLSQYEATGERLLEDWYSRTNIFNAVGLRLFLGNFDGSGLLCDDDWDWGVGRSDGLGVFPLGVSRELGYLDKSSESLKSEIDFLTDEVKKLKDKLERIKDIIKE